MERIPYLGHTIFKWQVGASSFLALPEKGARLMNWNVTLGDGSGVAAVGTTKLACVDKTGKLRRLPPEI